MSAFRDLVEAIQERDEADIDPVSVWSEAILAPLINRTAELAALYQQAATENWDRRKLKRMMRRAGQGKRTA